MTMQRAGNVEFKTIVGTLSRTDIKGFTFELIDDFKQAYLVEDERRTDRLSHLVGERIEVKGLVECDLSTAPKIHPIRVAPVEIFENVH